MFIIGLIIGLIIGGIVGAFIIDSLYNNRCPHDFHLETVYTSHRTNLPEFQIMKCSECGKLKKESI